MSATPCFVGIDVAKAQLDIALRPTGERWAVVNDDAGIAALVERLQALPPTLIVLEATGGYQRAVVAALAAAGLPWRWSILARLVTLPKRPDSWPKRMRSTRARWPISPRRCVRPPGPCRTPRPMNSAPCWHGGGNWSRCGRPNRIVWGMPPHGCRRTSRPISPGSITRLAALDDDLDTTLRTSPVWREREDLLRSVPGMGPVCTRTLLLDLPELGTLKPPAPGRFGRGRPFEPG